MNLILKMIIVKLILKVKQNKILLMYMNQKKKKKIIINIFFIKEKMKPIQFKIKMIMTINLIIIKTI